MGITSDRNDPRLSYGTDTEPVKQAEAYLVLTEKERKKGWVRPFRDSYIHQYVDLVTGRQGGCGVVTYMGREIAETYAKDPQFYGATYCMGCRMHLPVSEFLWDGTYEVVGS